MTKQQLYADLPAELLEADDILRRYGNWARPRIAYETCGSAEGNYKAPPNDADRLPSQPVMQPRDLTRARAALLAMPTMTRLVIQWLYVEPGSAQHYMRKNGIQPRHMRERHLEGVQLFWVNWRASAPMTYDTVAKPKSVLYDLAT